MKAPLLIRHATCSTCTVVRRSSSPERGETFSTLVGEIRYQNRKKPWASQASPRAYVGSRGGQDTQALGCSTAEPENEPLQLARFAPSDLPSTLVAIPESGWTNVSEFFP